VLHETHAAADVAATVAENLPTGHESQVVEPALTEYLPAAHCVHCKLPS
jgi:hypothetical protein